jgi:hypothetical protein
MQATLVTPRRGGEDRPREVERASSRDPRESLLLAGPQAGEKGHDPRRPEVVVPQFSAGIGPPAIDR